MCSEIFFQLFKEGRGGPSQKREQAVNDENSTLQKRRCLALVSLQMTNKEAETMMPQAGMGRVGGFLHHNESRK